MKEAHELMKRAAYLLLCEEDAAETFGNAEAIREVKRDLFVAYEKLQRIIAQ